MTEKDRVLEELSEDPVISHLGVDCILRKHKWTKGTQGCGHCASTKTKETENEGCCGQAPYSVYYIKKVGVIE